MANKYCLLYPYKEPISLLATKKWKLNFVNDLRNHTNNLKYRNVPGAVTSKLFQFIMIK
jgi:hypothetical protein